MGRGIQFMLAAAAAVFFLSGPVLLAATKAPNVLWICVDDMSDWLGCYGHTAVPTPHIDSLAESGVRFARAYMPSPVCSTTRSAMVTGTMPTSHGLHHHRTMIKKPLPGWFKTVPELFREAGYLTFNESKDDYNFSRDREAMYSPGFERPGIQGHLAGGDFSWMEQLQGRRFFGQIQLKGGKIGGEAGSKYPAESRVKPEQVEVPPYYPDHPVFRNAIARHYEQIAQTDEQVGAIMRALKKHGLWQDTVVFFFTDHGSPLPRSKQFLYEEGTKVPLVVHWPRGAERIMRHGAVRADLVSGIDIPAASLGLAGIGIPGYFEGRNFFAEELEARSHVISARDRCGIAVDRIRAVRTPRFRYIRNYQSDRAMYQRQYRQEFATFQTLRKLRKEGKLTPLQASYHDPSRRPAEELYDLRNDPHQRLNLAGDPGHGAELKRHRELLEQWEKGTGDKGRYPESRESLMLVYEAANGECPAPEFDFLREK